MLTFFTLIIGRVGKKNQCFGSGVKHPQMKIKTDSDHGSGEQFHKILRDFLPTSAYYSICMRSPNICVTY